MDMLNMKYHGIKCDNPNCGWADWSVKQEDYPNWVNRPCPVCGENLLTEECFKRTEAILQVGEKLNELFNLIFSDEDKQKLAEMGKEEVRFDIKSDGTLGKQITAGDERFDMKV